MRISYQNKGESSIGALQLYIIDVNLRRKKGVHSYGIENLEIEDINIIKKQKRQTKKCIYKKDYVQHYF